MVTIIRDNYFFNAGICSSVGMLSLYFAGLSLGSFIFRKRLLNFHSPLKDNGFPDRTDTSVAIKAVNLKFKLRQ